MFFFIWLNMIGEKSIHQDMNRILFFHTTSDDMQMFSQLVHFFDENESKSFKFFFPMHITDNLMVALKSLQWGEYRLKKCLNLIS